LLNGHANRDEESEDAGMEESASWWEMGGPGVEGTSDSAVTNLYWVTDPYQPAVSIVLESHYILVECRE